MVKESSGGSSSHHHSSKRHHHGSTKHSSRRGGESHISKKDRDTKRAEARQDAIAQGQVNMNEKGELTCSSCSITVLGSSNYHKQAETGNRICLGCWSGFESQAQAGPERYEGEAHTLSNYPPEQAQGSVTTPYVDWGQRKIDDGVAFHAYGDVNPEAEEGAAIIPSQMLLLDSDGASHGYGTGGAAHDTGFGTSSFTPYTITTPFDNQFEQVTDQDLEDFFGNH